MRFGRFANHYQKFSKIGRSRPLVISVFDGSLELPCLRKVQRGVCRLDQLKYRVLCMPDQPCECAMLCGYQPWTWGRGDATWIYGFDIAPRRRITDSHYCVGTDLILPLQDEKMGVQLGLNTSLKYFRMTTVDHWGLTVVTNFNDFVCASLGLDVVSGWGIFWVQRAPGLVFRYRFYSKTSRGLWQRHICP